MSATSEAVTATELFAVFAKASSNSVSSGRAASFSACPRAALIRPSATSLTRARIVCSIAAMIRPSASRMME
jgi:hypothetical protein